MSGLAINTVTFDSKTWNQTPSLVFSHLHWSLLLFAILAAVSLAMNDLIVRLDGGENAKFSTIYTPLMFTWITIVGIFTSILAQKYTKVSLRWSSRLKTVFQCATMATVVGSIAFLALQLLVSIFPAEQATPPLSAETTFLFFLALPSIVMVAPVLLTMGLNAWFWMPLQIIYGVDSKTALKLSQDGLEKNDFVKIILGFSFVFPGLFLGFDMYKASAVLTFIWSLFIPILLFLLTTKIFTRPA